MSVAPGTRLGVYEIRSVLGAGGMGVVYRALDPRLNRDVAIKVLPAALSAHPDRLRRFEQEARATASLNHPNILAVYDIGAHDGAPFIVSELLEGETLRATLARALPVKKIVNYAIQTANGLAITHAKGVVHRDLKPDNLFVTSDGRIKILDFGLAKLTELERPGGETATLPHTVTGTVMGTAAYLSPEQARGLTADHRADIFALGATMYEALAGRRAFTGATTADTIAAIVRDEPPDLGTIGSIPPALARIVMRCLEKDPAARFQSASDLAFALEGVSEFRSSSALPIALASSTMNRRLAIMTWAVAATAVLVVGVPLWQLGRDHSPPSTMYASIDVPPDYVLGDDDAPGALPSRLPMVFTPDGGSLIMQGAKAGKRQLFIRALDKPDTRPIPGTENANSPFVSPDGKWIGFAVAGELRKVPLEGGTPTTIYTSAAHSLYGMAWGPDESIIVAEPSGILRVSANGGTVSRIASAPPTRNYTTPIVLPDGKRILFSDVGPEDAGNSRVMLQSLSGGDARVVIDSASDARLLPSGRLAFMRLGTLMTVPFDVANGESRGEPTAELTNVMQTGIANRVSVGMFAISSRGALAAVRGPLIGPGERRLIWLTRDGQSSPAESMTGTPAGGRRFIRIAPDQQRAAVIVETARRAELWVADWTRDVWTPCRDCKADLPTWSPDSRRLLGSYKGTLVAHAVDESAPDEVMVEEAGRDLSGDAWLADGRIVYTSRALSPPTLEIKVLDPGAKNGRTIAQGAYDASVSPDHRWIAYVSNYSIVVQAFPGPGPHTQVSAARAVNPAWGPDGRTLYYVGFDHTLFAVDVVASDRAIKFGPPRVLFSHPAVEACGLRCYDVSSNPPRFLISVKQPNQVKPVTRLDLIVNWLPALAK